MNYEQMSNNQLYLTGTVVREPKYTHEVYGEAFYETALSVERLSHQVDIIPVTISDRLIEARGIRVGEKIRVMGQFRSYNKQDGDRSRLLLTAFVREILDPDESANPNTIEITGYICKPPVYRTTPFQREICDVLIAVNRAYNKSDYIPCILWGRNARYVQNMPVGERLTLSGRIQSRVYSKTVDGDRVEERTAYEVSVCKILEEEKPFKKNENCSNLAQ